MAPANKSNEIFSIVGIFEFLSFMFKIEISCYFGQSILKFRMNIKNLSTRNLLSLKCNKNLETTKMTYQLKKPYVFL